MPSCWHHRARATIVTLVSLPCSSWTGGRRSKLISLLPITGWPCTRMSLVSRSGPAVRLFSTPATGSTGYAHALNAYEEAFTVGDEQVNQTNCILIRKIKCTVNKMLPFLPSPHIWSIHICRLNVSYFEFLSSLESTLHLRDQIMSVTMTTSQSLTSNSI